jgi:hypothetical protein
MMRTWVENVKLKVGGPVEMPDGYYPLLMYQNSSETARSNTMSPSMAYQTMRKQMSTTVFTLWTRMFSPHSAGRTVPD